MNEELPEKLDILVIADMKTPLSENEMTRLNAYIERGGNLLIVGETETAGGDESTRGTIGCPIPAGTTRTTNRTFFTGSRACQGNPGGKCNVLSL